MTTSALYDALQLAALQPEHLISRRYTLLEHIGEGGFGVVWQARDERLEREVAIKFLQREDAQQTWREASILRRLSMEAGARLLDEGVYKGWPFMVMEHIAGSAFPGTGTQEPALVIERAISLLEELARLHAAGIVHADLKPTNALVEHATGRVVLLDFGLSRLMTPNRHHHLQREGTPRYMAPEQLRAMPTSPSSDLYAVGVMLHEALSGSPPHSSDSLTALMRARLMQPAPSLRSKVPGCPAHLAALVDDLLERDPRLRPESAEDAVARLRDHSAPQADGLPTQAHLDTQQALRIFARTGSIDLGVHSKEDARSVIRGFLSTLKPAPALRHLGAGTTPFESLLEAMGLYPDPEQGASALADTLTQAMRQAHEQGEVFVCEHPDEMDVWSERLLEQLRTQVSVVRARLGKADVSLQPLSPAELATFFQGPQAGFHLPEDAAHELYLRTGGWPERLEGELEAWRARGLARRVRQRWACDREALDWLAGHGKPMAMGRSVPELDELVFEDIMGWLKLLRGRARIAELEHLMDQPRWEVEALLEELARRRLVTVHAGEVMALMQLAEDDFAPARRELLLRRLEPENPTRVKLLLDDPGSHDLVGAAIGAARMLDERGESAQAFALLRESALTLRQRGSTQMLETLCMEMARVALASPAVEQLERLLFELEEYAPEHTQLKRLVELARQSCRKPDDEVIGALRALGEQEDTTLELRRRMYMVRAALWSASPELEEIVHQAHDWAQALGEPELCATTAGWKGQRAYARRDFDEASSLHAFAASHKRRASARIASRINQVWALLDGDKGEQAAQVVEQAIEEARACRHAVYELQGLQLQRWISYRQGELPGEDADLLEAIGLLGNIEFEARTFTIEAAVSWRQGKAQRAKGYAERAAECWTSSGQMSGALLCRALMCALRGEEVTREQELVRLSASVAAIKAPFLAVQALGLIGSVRALSDEHQAVLRGHVQGMDEQARQLRREILSVAEALEMAQVSL